MKNPLSMRFDLMRRRVSKKAAIKYAADRASSGNNGSYSDVKILDCTSEIKGGVDCWVVKFEALHIEAREWFDSAYVIEKLKHVRYKGDKLRVLVGGECLDYYVSKGRGLPPSWEWPKGQAK
tara:strand:- start:6981 stop:7346 length:366 start_codon:yes stop_codon:yes gene_type:complete